MKKLFTFLLVLCLIAAVGAVGILGIKSNGFTDWSFMQENEQPAPDETTPDDNTNPGGTTTPGGSTTPGGETDSGGSTTPGGSTSEHVHDFRFSDVLHEQTIKGYPYRVEYDNIPNSMQDYDSIDEFYFTEGSCRYIFYLAHKPSEAGLYVLDSDERVLQVFSYKGAQNLPDGLNYLYKISLALSDCLHIEWLGYREAGIGEDSAIPILKIRYSLCTCSKCGASKPDDYTAACKHVYIKYCCAVDCITTVYDSETIPSEHSQYKSGYGFRFTVEDISGAMTTYTLYAFTKDDDLPLGQNHTFYFFDEQYREIGEGLDIGYMMDEYHTDDGGWESYVYPVDIYLHDLHITELSTPDYPSDEVVFDIKCEKPSAVCVKCGATKGA